jgi:hypothetical protein
MPTESDKAQPKEYQKYIDQMRKELEESYEDERRQTGIWFYLPLALTSIGIVILLFFLLLVLSGLIEPNSFPSLLLRNTAFAVAWLLAGISLIFIGRLIDRQVQETNLQIDNYYVSRIQKAKRLTRLIAISTEIDTFKSNPDLLNEIIMKQLLDLLTQGEEIPKQPSEASTKK